MIPGLAKVSLRGYTGIVPNLTDAKGQPILPGTADIDDEPAVITDAFREDGDFMIEYIGSSMDAENEPIRGWLFSTDGLVWTKEDGTAVSVAMTTEA